MTKDIFQAIKKTDADFVQANFLEAGSSSVSFENKKIKDFSNILSNHVSVSVWIGKKHGNASSNVFSEELLKKAVRIAKNSEEMEFFYGLPEIKKKVFVKGLYHGEKSEEEILDSAKSLLIETGKKEFIPEINVNYGCLKNHLINSLGTDLEEKSSMFSASLSLLIKDKQVISNSDDVSMRKIPSQDFLNNFSQRILEETREMRNPIKLKKFPKVVLLEQPALASLLNSAFLSNFNGLNVLKKRSIFDGKENQKIVSEKLNLFDSGILDGGIGSQNFDGEGSPSQITSLVENGILKSFIYDYNISKHLGKKTTGNSTGGGIDFNNVLIEKGKGIEEDEILSIKNVIGAHTANDLTTEFSVNSFGTFLIKNGERKPVKDVMINGKMIDALNNISCVGKETRNIGSIYLPKISFRGINVGGI